MKLWRANFVRPLVSLFLLLREYGIEENWDAIWAVAILLHTHTPLEWQKEQLRFVDEKFKGLLHATRNFMQQNSLVSGDERCEFLVSQILSVRNRIAVLPLGESLSGTGADNAPGKGRYPASEPPLQEAQVSTNQHRVVGNTLFIDKQKTLRRGGRPAKGARKAKGSKLRMFGVKLTDEEFALIEKLRKRTGVFSAAETIRGALRTYDVITGAIDAGQEVIIEHPKRKSDRKYLKFK